MAWRPCDWFLEGELDNTVKGWTTGWVKIQGPENPVTLKLRLVGNCHPDLAGWKFRIVRTDPIPEWAEPLSNLEHICVNQSGHIGDVTADQMLKHIECSPKEFVRRSYAGDPPATTWRKALYLEWFSHANGRVVVQSTLLGVERLGRRAFELSADEWIEQAKQNASEMDFFMSQLEDAIENGALEDCENQVEPDAPAASPGDPVKPANEANKDRQDS